MNLTNKFATALSTLAALTLFAGSALAGGEPSEETKVTLPCANSTDCCEKVADHETRITELERLVIPAKKKATGPRTPPTVNERIEALRLKLMAEYAKGSDANATVINTITVQLQEQNAQLQSILGEIASHRADIVALQAADARHDANDARHDANDARHDSKIAAVEKDVKELQDSKASDAIDAGLQVGGLVYHSELYDYSAVTVTANIKFKFNDKFSLVLGGGSSVTDLTFVTDGALLYNLGSGFSVGPGAQYFAGGFTNGNLISNDALNGLVRVDFQYKVLNLTVDGLLGKAGNFENGGSHELGYGGQLKAGVLVF